MNNATEIGSTSSKPDLNLRLNMTSRSSAGWKNLLQKI
jgi:hypothetical protein